tara:strand:+ start:123 stop:356 length:234 start_codon:yes stop_codon:yes gene_type:complete
MEKYNPDAKCGACGFGCITTRHEDRRFDHYSSPIQYRMVRTCCNCGKVWRELPLDHDAEEERAGMERLKSAVAKYSP